MKYIMGALLFLSVALRPMTAQEDRWRQAMLQGVAARQAGDLDTAERAYEEALLAAKADSRFRYERALVIAKQGELYHDLQRTTEAERAYREASDLLHELPSSPVVDHTLRSLALSTAVLYLDLEQPSKARQLQLERLIPNLTDQAEIGSVNSILASIALAQGQFAEAESLWNIALSVFESANRREDVAIVLSNLGALSAKKNDYPGAVARFKRSVQIFEIEMGLEHPRSLKAQANLGQILVALGRYQEASELLQRGCRIGRRWFGEHQPNTLYLCGAYAEALRKTGRKTEAKAVVDQMRQAPPGVSAAIPGRNTVDILSLAPQPKK